MREEYRLYIGIPTYNKPDTRFSIDTYGDLMFHIGRKHPEIKKLWRERNVRTYRASARQAIIESAVKHHATHLLMLDDDMTFDPDTFDKIWNVCIQQENPSAVSAMYFTRGKPATVPCIWRLGPRGTVPIYEYPKDAVLTDKEGLEVVGFGCILFDMRVVDVVKLPWFDLGKGWGEDAAFCARMLQSGCTLAVHTGAMCGHIHEDPVEITEQDYLAIKGRILENEQMGTHSLVQVIEDDRDDPAGPYTSRGNKDQRSLDARRGWRPKSGKWAEISRGIFGQ